MVAKRYQPVSPLPNNTNTDALPAHFPLLATAHEYDFLFELRRTGPRQSKRCGGCAPASGLEEFLNRSSPLILANLLKPVQVLLLLKLCDLVFMSEDKRG